MISGYLLGKKVIPSQKALINTVVQRYVRFAVPLFFANLFVLLIDKSVGFASSQCGSIVGSTWMASKYMTSFTFADVVSNTLLLGNELNETFWIIRHMLVASCIIYFINYVATKSRKHLAVLKAVISGIFLMFPYTFFIGAVYLGSCLELLITAIEKNENTKRFWKALAILSAIMLTGVQNFFSQIMGLRFLTMNQYWETAYVIILLITVFMSVQLQNFFEPNVLRSASSQSSFSLYVIHWPLICSVFSRTFIFILTITKSFAISYIGNLIASIVLLTGLVLIYDRIVGVLCGDVLNRVTGLLNRIFLGEKSKIS